MTKNIKSVFREGCPDLVIDQKWCRKLHAYVQGFANKNEDHIAFFGGNLIGVHTVRFRTEDRNKWFDEILEADDLSIEDELHRLEAIVPTRQISADVMNLSCLWLVHEIYNSTKLNPRDKQEAMIDTIMVLQYKFITSILAYFFRYPADEAVATATYAALSKKFGLKVYGSWGALLHARAVDILATNGIHFKTYSKFEDDFAIVYMVNDIQGRIKDIIKNITDVFYLVAKDPKGLIRTTSNTVSLDGTTHVKDLKRQYPTYRRYLHSVIGDRNTFIREELVKIISSAMPTMPEKLLVETLQYCSLNYGPKGDKDIEKFADAVLTHLFDFLSSNRNAIQSTNDIGGLIAKLRNLYMASRTTDPVMLGLREVGESLVQRSVRSKNTSVISATRTGLMLYIVLRTLTMHHYSK